MPLLPSALPPKGEARRYAANDFLNLIELPRGEGFVSGILLSPSNLRPFGAPPSYGRRECTCQQKLDTKLKKLGIKIEYLYKIQ